MAGQVAAQIPQTFTNLEVLPEDIDRRELIGIMRGFAGALGVRCNFCHVGENPDNLDGYDFASDEKETKLTARTMIRMVRVINGEYLATVGAELEVQCATCHRGVNRPEPLQDVLVAAWRAGGTDSLLSTYHAYRARYYGRASYDFGEPVLVNTAEDLSAIEGGLPAAVRTLELQVELFPDYGFGWATLGQARAEAADTVGALAAFDRAVEIMGPVPQLQRLISRLRGQ